MENSLTSTDMLTPDLRLAAQRAGNALAKLSEAELLLRPALISN